MIKLVCGVFLMLLMMMYLYIHIFIYLPVFIFFRDVPTMFSVLHPLDEPRPMTSKIDGTVA